MDPRFDVDTAQFAAKMRQLSRLNGKALSQTMVEFARTTLTNRQGTGLMDITPPAIPGRWGSEAKQQGERAIERDIARHFVPIKSTGVGPRGESPMAIHLAMFRYKVPGRPLRRNRAAPYYVDARKLAAYVRDLKRHVGRYAAGWLASAQKLGARVPAWIRRHGVRRGSCRVQLRAPRYEIEMNFSGAPRGPAGETERRVRMAMSMTEKRLDRAIAGTVEANARAVGLKTAA